MVEEDVKLAKLPLKESKVAAVSSDILRYSKQCGTVAHISRIFYSARIAIFV